jgi:hypothetical protein
MTANNAHEKQGLCLKAIFLIQQSYLSFWLEDGYYNERWEQEGKLKIDKIYIRKDPQCHIYFSDIFKE